MKSNAPVFWKVNVYNCSILLVGFPLMNMSILPCLL